MLVDQAIEELKRFLPTDENGLFHLAILNETSPDAPPEMIFYAAPDEDMPPSGFVTWCEVKDGRTSGVSERRSLEAVMNAKTDQFFLMNDRDFIAFVEAHLSGAIHPISVQ